MQVRCGGTPESRYVVLRLLRWRARQKLRLVTAIAICFLTLRDFLFNYEGGKPPQTLICTLNKKLEENVSL